MIKILQTTDCMRLACEACGAHTTVSRAERDSHLDGGEWFRCEVCGLSARVQRPGDREREPVLAMSA